MEPRIDAYMLTIDEPEGWRAAAIESLSHPDIRLELMHTNRDTPMGDDWVDCIAKDGAEYISFVDPDNIYNASAFVQMADSLDACPQASLAYTDETLIDSDGQFLGNRRLAYSRWVHVQRADLVHSCVMYRRSAARTEVGFIDGLLLYPEWMLTLRLSRKSPVLHLPIIGRKWRQHPEQAHRRSADADLQRVRSAAHLP